MTRHLRPTYSGLTYEASEDWRSSAACLNAPDVEVFHRPRDGEAIREAKAICLPCPVRLDCLAFAMRNDPLDSVFGGLTRKERANLRRRQQRAAS